ncbi:MAG TPA: S8 family serine peptidase [Candidatus Elarobacter sp.]
MLDDFIDLLWFAVAKPHRWEDELECSEERLVHDYRALWCELGSIPAIDYGKVDDDYTLLKRMGLDDPRALLNSRPSEILSGTQLPWDRLATYRTVAKLHLLRNALKAYQALKDNEGWSDEGLYALSPQVAVSLAETTARSDDGFEVVVQMRDILPFESVAAMDSGAAIQRRRAHARETQANLLSRLELSEEVYVQLWLSNQFIAPLSRWAIRRAAEDSNVRRISPVLQVRACMDEAMKRVSADMLVAGSTGASQVVALIDSGIDETHPDLAGRVVHKRNYVNGSQCADELGHGTHLAGIVGARHAQYRGVAPDATLWCYRILDEEGRGSQTALSRAIHDIVQDSTDDGRMVVANCSFDVPRGQYVADQDVDNLCRNFDEATSDIVVVTAAGNSGPEPASISGPGAGHRVLTVGATMNRPGGTPDVVSPFTSRGPATGNRIKPDIVAPGGLENPRGAKYSGVSMVSCRTVGATLDRSTSDDKPWHCDDDHYGLSGTSQAAALVSGVCALLLEHAQRSNRRLSHAQIAEALRSSARRLGWGPYEEGYGLISADAACARL